MAQGGIVYGNALSNGAGNGDTVMNGTVPPCVSNPSDAAVQGGEAIAEQSAESPDKIFWRELAFINYYHDYLLKRMVDKFK